MGCQCSQSQEPVRYVKTVTTTSATPHKSSVYTSTRKVQSTKEIKYETRASQEGIDTHGYTFRDIDRLIWEIQDESQDDSLRDEVRLKCRLLLYLLQLQRKSIRNDQRYTLPRRDRMQEVLASLNSPLMAQIKATNRSLSDIYKITFDGLCILLHLYVRPVQVVPIRLTQRLAVDFWHDSFAQSGQILVSPVFDFRNDLIKLTEGGNINGQTLELLEPLVREQWFCEEIAGRVSRAVGYIVSWIKNLWEYARANRVVLKKRRKVIKVQRWITSWMKRNFRDVYLESGLQ